MALPPTAVATLPAPQACRFCRAPIIMVRTEKDRLMPLDAAPNDDGNVTVVLLPEGVIRAYVDAAGAPARIGTRFMPHFATCPNYRRRKGNRNATRSTDHG